MASRTSAAGLDSLDALLLGLIELPQIILADMLTLPALVSDLTKLFLGLRIRDTHGTPPPLYSWKTPVGLPWLTTMVPSYRDLVNGRTTLRI